MSNYQDIQSIRYQIFQFHYIDAIFFHRFYYISVFIIRNFPTRLFLWQNICQVYHISQIFLYIFIKSRLYNR